MGRMRVRVDDEVKAKLRRVAAEKFNNRKGYMQAAIREAVNQWLEEKESKKPIQTFKYDPN